MTDHEMYRELSAGFVLGALDPDERRRFESHLRGCAECRREVASFAPLPGLLSRIGGLETESLPAGVAERAAARARSEWVALARSRRSWRWASAAAALVAVVTLVVALVPRVDRPAVTTLAVRPGVVGGEVAIDARPWGTVVHLELEGLPERDRYVAWVIDDSGNTQQAATWGPTPTGVAKLQGASSIPADRVAFVTVTTGDGTETLLSAIVTTG